MSGVRGYAKALQLAFEREYARKDKDYLRGDELRDELHKLGVSLDDKEHMFSLNGYTGYYILSRGVSFREVQLICLDREHARRENNYDEADLIRDQLLDLQVQVSDKAKTFTMPDGQQGSYDLKQVEPQQREQAFLPPGPVGQPYGPAGGGRPIGQLAPLVGGHPYRAPVGLDARPAGPLRGGEGTGDRFANYCATLSLAIEREQARKAGDYGKADIIRNELRTFGAEVSDKTKTFTLGGGTLEGTYDLNIGITAHEIQMVALEREEVRRGKDYKASDRLRNWLGDLGVTLDDKDHMFRTKDGVEGSYDLYKWSPVGRVQGR